MTSGWVALGKYRLQRPLGQGSNAEVYLAEPLSGGPPVVVKRIHAHITTHPKFQQMFEAEVRSMAQLRHPYTVRLYEAGVDSQLGPCLVMEYVAGVTLEQLLQRRRRFDIERTGKLLGCICHALQHAHTAGIIHRDLKPANLMVQRAGTIEESLKVMDFGFAGFATRPFIQPKELTGHGTVQALGTPSYVSPEMIRGDTVDRRSDLYSVGVILFEMLTGRLPFPHPEVAQVLAAHVRQAPPRFAQVGIRDIPPEIEHVVQLTLSKYPNERPQTARELATMYSQAIGWNIWEASRPPNWDETAMGMPVLTASDSREQRHPQPFEVVHRLTVEMPERMVAAKLKGFMEDFKGLVVTSEPGLIILRLGLPPGYRSAPATASGIFRWLQRTRPRVEKDNEPIEVELRLLKPDPQQPRLQLTLYYRPLPEYPPRSATIWQKRCNKLNDLIRQYLGA
ncbi:MAG: serine/threonine protein kinase [Gemmataceae bacterium]|nr:serine/threonine protein kinase [Gemmataceae bacterium]MDW8242365.1 serine/threonine-protein kinase [Thermogemmata sp.]